MSEPAKIVVLSPEELESLITRAVREALKGTGESRESGLRDKEWLKAKEAAELYGLPKTWFEERGRVGDIERTKPGRYVLFKRRDVEAYLESKKNNHGTG